MPPARLGGLLVCAGAAMSLVLSLTSPAYSNGRPMLTIVPSLIACSSAWPASSPGPGHPAGRSTLVPGIAGALIIVSMWATNTPLDGSQLLFVWCTFFAGYFLRDRARGGHDRRDRRRLHRDAGRPAGPRRRGSVRALPVDDAGGGLLPGAHAASSGAGRAGGGADGGPNRPVDRTAQPPGPGRDAHPWRWSAPSGKAAR